MVELLIKNVETDNIGMKKKIPLSWTISNIKNFFAKLYKIPVGVIFLLFRIKRSNFKYRLILKLNKLLKTIRTLVFIM